MWSPYALLTDLSTSSGWKYKVSDCSGNGIEFLEIWFGKTVDCGATFKLLIYPGYLYSRLRHGPLKHSTGFCPSKIVHCRIIIVFC